MNNNDNGSLFGAKKRVSDFFMQNKLEINYKDVENLKKFISPEGKILPSRRTGLTAQNQRAVTRAIKRSRQAGLLPFKVIEN